MPKIYGRDLDLNLLRVFAVVAESGSVTEAAHRLYMTQPAVSAALRRLTTTIGAPLFARSGRGLALTSRGERLRAGLEPHLQALVDAALMPPTFDPATNDRTLRLGLSDSTELWLLPPLLRTLEREAPRMRLVAIPVQFRTVAAALAAGLAAAVTVADDLPAMIRREPLFHGGFTCLYDPRHARLRRLTEAEYFARDHVIVSYNGDLRGIVEDLFEKTRKIRCSVSSFANLGALIDGTAMLATIPDAGGDADPGDPAAPEDQAAPVSDQGLARRASLAERHRRRRALQVRANQDQGDREDAPRSGLMADDSEQLEPGRAAFNRGEYFLAHELWEEVWRQVDDAERRLHVQGLIQIAAGLHHLQRHRAGPAAGLLRKGLEKLSQGQQEGEASRGRLRTDLLAREVERLLVELDVPGDETAAADFSHLKL